MIPYDLCCQHSQRLYSMIRVCIIMMHLTRLYRVAKAIYGIIISIEFSWWLGGVWKGCSWWLEGVQKGCSWWAEWALEQLQSSSGGCDDLGVAVLPACSEVEVKGWCAENPLKSLMTSWVHWWLMRALRESCQMDVDCRIDVPEAWFWGWEWANMLQYNT